MENIRHHNPKICPECLSEEITDATTYGDILKNIDKLKGTPLRIAVPMGFQAYLNDKDIVEEIDVTIESAEPYEHTYIDGVRTPFDGVTVHFRNADRPEIHVEDIYKGDKWRVFMKSAYSDTPFLADLKNGRYETVE